MTFTRKDNYSDAEIQAIKAEIWSDLGGSSNLTASVKPVIIAEGDSWFDYPIGLDILDYLKGLRQYDVRKFAEAGDTLENMVYGTEYRRGFRRRPPQLLEVLEEVQSSAPRVFLFSGGGNDIAGPELGSFLNHRGSGLPAVREEYAKYMFGTVFRQAYQDLFRRVWEVDDTLSIIGHGYGNTIPDGRGYRRIGIKWAGPWLRPAMTAKGWVDPAERRQIMQKLLDGFNVMLSELAEGESRFHYLDLRPHINDTRDWENELHLNTQAFRRVADLFHRKIQSLLTD